MTCKHFAVPLSATTLSRHPKMSHLTAQIRPLESISLRFFFSCECDKNKHTGMPWSASRDDSTLAFVNRLLSLLYLAMPRCLSQESVALCGGNENASSKCPFLSPSPMDTTKACTGRCPTKRPLGQHASCWRTPERRVAFNAHLEAAPAPCEEKVA